MYTKGFALKYVISSVYRYSGVQFIGNACTSVIGVRCHVGFFSFRGYLISITVDFFCLNNIKQFHEVLLIIILCLILS